MRMMKLLNVESIDPVEHITLEPQKCGATLERLGFTTVARHRSQETDLNRAGGVDLTVSSSVHSSDNSSTSNRSRGSFEWVESRAGAAQ